MPFDGHRITKEAAYLINAKNYLLTHGWCANGPNDDAGRVCTVMAMTENKRLPQDAMYFSACAIFAKSLGLEDADPNTVGSWNDSPYRRKSHVIEAFDKAIAAAMECS